MKGVFCASLGQAVVCGAVKQLFLVEGSSSIDQERPAIILDHIPM